MVIKPLRKKRLFYIKENLQREQRKQQRLISQLPTDQWYANIGDNTLADAILDRLMHNAHRLLLKGESMRKIMSDLTQDEHLG